MATSAEKSKNIAQHCCCTIRTSGNRPNCAALKLLDNMAHVCTVQLSDL